MGALKRTVQLRLAVVVVAVVADKPVVLAVAVVAQEARRRPWWVLAGDVNRPQYQEGPQDR